MMPNRSIVWLKALGGWLAAAFAHTCHLGILLLQLTWRCIYPCVSALFLIVFFTLPTISQGTEFLKIFIVGERVAYEYWSLSVGFAVVCFVNWLVAREILLSPWAKQAYVPEASPPHSQTEQRAGIWLLFMVGILPMLLMIWHIRGVAQDVDALRQTTMLSKNVGVDLFASVCHLITSAAQCSAWSPGVQAAMRTMLFPPQWALFAGITVIMVVLMARLAISSKRFNHLPLGRIAFAIGFILWFGFHASVADHGSASTVSFFQWQMQFQRWMGTVFILLLALLSWTLFGGFVLTLYCKRRLGVSLALLPVLMIALSSPWRYDSDDVRTLPIEQKASKGQHLHEALVAFRLRNAHNAASPIPTYLIAAAGGGLRASYWSASILGDLHDAHPAFSNHVFLMSGVSGGGLGAATYIAGLQGACPPATVEDSMGDCMRRVLEDVTLGPTVSNTLYGDLWRAMFPAAIHNALWNALFGWWLGPQSDRAMALERTWESSFAWCAPHPEVSVDPKTQIEEIERTFRCRKRGEATPAMIARARASNVLAQSLPGLYQSTNKAGTVIPNLIINGTDVATGRRILTSNLRLCGPDFPDAYIARADHAGRWHLRLSTAVLNGARFPLVSPAGRVDNPGLQMIEAPWRHDPQRKSPDLECPMQTAQIDPAALPVCTDEDASYTGDRKRVACSTVAQSVHRIVDGGYFDNSGLDTVRDVLDEIASFNAARNVVTTPALLPIVVVIDNAGWTHGAKDADETGAFGSVFNAYTNAQDARSNHDLMNEIVHALVPDQGAVATQRVFVVNLDRRDRDVPGLGWALSEASTNQMIYAATSPGYLQRLEEVLTPLGKLSEDALDQFHTRQRRRCMMAVGGTAAFDAMLRTCMKKTETSAIISAQFVPR
jgi:hypothetical protein